MTSTREIAKFLSGAEAFHAVAHAYFSASETTIIILGVTVTPEIGAISAVVNALIALGLGCYAWGFKKAS